MELEKFIAESIIESIKGVVSAQRDQRIIDLGAIIAPSWSQKAYATYQPYEKSDVKDIEIEVAVTASDKNAGGIGINVMSIISGNKSNEVSNASVSRVKISVPVMYPTFDYPDKSED